MTTPVRPTPPLGRRGPQALPLWGIVTTAKAPRAALLDFAAWHIDLGAHRIYLHLDAPGTEDLTVLAAHPRVRLIPTGAGYWRRTAGYRPRKHQVRQVANATRVLARPPEVDWLAHIDIDEFLMPARPEADCVARNLAALPETALCARLHPVEALAPADPGSPPRHAKTAARDRSLRRSQTARLFPDFAAALDGGFLSHVAGKLFVRTALRGAEFRIHNLRREGAQNPGQVDLPDLPLCHLHAADLDSWLAAYRFRHDRGAYRAGLRPAPAMSGQGMRLHDLLRDLEDREGEVGLRRFFDAVCTARPPLLSALRKAGRLQAVTLDLPGARQRQFPDA